MYKKILIITMISLLVIGVVGCSRPYAEITSGKIELKEDRTLTTISIELQSGLLGYWELYPEINSTLMDNIGNEYHALQTLSGSNFSGEISDSGVYKGTLVFPELKEKASFLKLKIDNVRHYTSSKNYGYTLEGNYSISFNFELEENEHASINKNKHYDTEYKIDNDELVKREEEKDSVEASTKKVYKLKSVTVTTPKGETYNIDRVLGN